MRLFVAVPLDDAAHERLAAAMADARRTADSHAWRFVRSEGVHLTLKFLGEVDESAVTELRTALGRAVAGAGAFDMEMHGIGAFPTPSHPRVLWAGVREGASRLAELASSVDRELTPLGFQPETRAFAAHLTLARSRDPRQARSLAGWIAAHADEPFGRLPVRAVVLFQSLLSREGSTYLPLATFSLTMQ